MEEIMNAMNDCYKLISSIAVKEGDVEIMAAAKAKLRAAYKAAQEMRKEPSNGQADKP